MTNIKTKNLLSDVIFILSLYLFYTLVPYFRDYFSEVHQLFVSFSTLDFFFWFTALFIIFIFFFRIFKNNQKPSKTLIFFSVLGKFFLFLLHKKHFRISQKEKTASLSLFIRSFYFPLMANWLFFHSGDLLFYLKSLPNFYYQLNSSNIVYFFNNYLFWLFFNLCFFIDTFVFASAYLLESRKLGNVIRSVEPTVFGWVVALACYPPFNQITNNVIAWETKDSVTDFTNQNVNLFFNFLILFSFAIYAWASLALGFKAGNLVNRGIVTIGPYRYVRHPAYISKNFAWWIGSLPFLVSAWQIGIGNAVIVFINVALWSLIYYFRAITEENHLVCDPDYIKYKKKVRWRFVPKIF